LQGPALNFISLRHFIIVNETIRTVVINLEDRCA
jgi:hypothetical protein